MKVTTKEQRRALYAVWLRDTEFYADDHERRPINHLIGRHAFGKYLKFRRQAYHSHMGCMMLPWHGMWLGIEPDGYTHS
jgi:hypothetical protein